MVGVPHAEGYSRELAEQDIVEANAALEVGLLSRFDVEAQHGEAGGLALRFDRAESDLVPPKTPAKGGRKAGFKSPAVLVEKGQRKIGLVELDRPGVDGRLDDIAEKRRHPNGGA